MQVLATWIVSFSGNLTKIYCCRDNWWFIENEQNELIQIGEDLARKIIEGSKFEKS